MFFQALCCPLSKASGYDTAHTIPQGNNHIKVIESGQIHLTVGGSCSEFLNN